MLNLRQLASDTGRESSDQRHISRFSINFRAPASILGNIGEPLTYGQPGYVMCEETGDALPNGDRSSSAQEPSHELARNHKCARSPDIDVAGSTYTEGGMLRESLRANEIEAAERTHSMN